MKVLTVIGNRPQFIKAAAVSPGLRREHHEVLVHTGQHFDDRLSAVFFAELGSKHAWPMPLPEELKDDLKSTVADLANVSGSRYAGMLVAGTYLREFVADGVQWAHIDIAGPSFNNGSPYGYTHKQGTGCTVRTLVAYVEDILAAA